MMNEISIFAISSFQINQNRFEVDLFKYWDIFKTHPPLCLSWQFAGCERGSYKIPLFRGPFSQSSLGFEIMYIVGVPPPIGLQVMAA